MNITIKYILIVLILIQTATATPINDPSFEYSIPSNWTIYAPGDMNHLQTIEWRTDGVYSLRLDETSQLDCMIDQKENAGYVYQEIDLTDVDNITYDARLTIGASTGGDVSGYDLVGNIKVDIDTINYWESVQPTPNYANTFNQISIDTSGLSGNHIIYLKMSYDISCECLGCGPIPPCMGTLDYEINAYFDNFTVIYTPSPPIPETTTFDDLFNCPTLWCMLTVVFSTYEDECSGGGLSLFWTIIILIPFMMTWIKQQSVIIPSILALITGSTLFALLPDTTMSTIIPLLSIGIMGLLYHIIKSR